PEAVMKTRRVALGVAVLAVSMPVQGRADTRPAPPSYRKLTEIPIGGEGGWDYLSVDPASRRLYVSHSTRIVVVDIDRNAVVGEIAPTAGVHGIALATDLGRGFVSNGRDATVSIVDLQTLKTIGTVNTSENPDAILYAPLHPRRKPATVLDARTGDAPPTIPLPGSPEFSVFDEQAGRIYVNIEDTSQLVAIDPSKRAVGAPGPM